MGLVGPCARRTAYPRALFSPLKAQGNHGRCRFGANVKLDSVLTDVMGKSGHVMIEALIAGKPIPPNWPALPIGGSRRYKKLRQALRGRVTKHHNFLLGSAQEGDHRRRRLPS
jgi:hypothetical protein